ncbi:uncharacterized protein BO87DRAFT_461044 [Aspergillus neoniger CBS 115656]|uniref:WD-like domain-containing protein n=1 Tax=Aspergillus neoniger (strain CBS 115656) TaxID=1448310 RepID=A0A318YC92_ASPNB|nr:hypothetical protein BO87DRAFT_461044 [Aspergillus neoniger CBS 115656]PYH31996.1 hypothetical protein BO87DRAFT_461044 [Aspergillus neoniger CBS 115656]
MAGNPQFILKWLSLFAMVLGAFSGATDELFLDLDGESYVSAVRESRYGDAVWARYHMDGRAVGNIIEADNTTVTKELLDDATGYRLGNPELYNQVATRYNTTSSNDGHRELVDIIIGVLDEDLKALEKRDVTYTIKCSSSNLAPRSSCYELLQDMNQYQTDLGSTRSLDLNKAGPSPMTLGPLDNRRNMNAHQ